MLKLRPFQKAALSALENNPSIQSHVLCVAPTGAGKSLIYERAALTPNRRTILVTPLVALARQQLQRLSHLGISVFLGAGGAAQVPKSESGIWIISPEVLLFTSRQLTLARWKPNLLVVDECHCIFEWGDSFRPAFKLVPQLIADYAIPHSLWLTATLPLESRIRLREIIPKPMKELGTFELPPQLHLSVQQVPLAFRIEALLLWISQMNAPGIVFVSTREATQRIARAISALGKNVIAYHGGLSPEERKNLERLVEIGIPDVVVATSAFGMGMNYPHLSFVVLWQAPTSPLSLVQTIGRVGRTSQTQSRALVFWDYEDFRLLEWTIQNSERRRSELLNLLSFFQTQNCRKVTLKKYFDGFESSIRCNSCDFCLTI